MATLNSSLGANMTNFYPGTTLTSWHDGECYGNLTLCFNNEILCNLDNCDLSLGQIRYRPTLPGNAIFAAIFGIAIIVQLVLGIRTKTWAFMVATVCGFALEAVGYVARILLYNNPFDNNMFIIYLVCLTIAPAFLSGAIYLCLARIVVVYGESLSRFKPRSYTIVFCSCDFFSLLLQAIGGAIASVSTARKDIDTGVNIMIAGLVFQVFSLLLFAAACSEFAFRCYKNPQSWSPSHASLYTSKMFRAFLVGLAVATLTIFVRSAYRVAELNAGFDSDLANDEVTFMILEAAMIIIATICLSVLHPGVSFKGRWAAANFSYRNKKGHKSAGDSGMESIGSFDDAEAARTHEMWGMNRSGRK